MVVDQNKYQTRKHSLGSVNKHYISNTLFTWISFERRLSVAHPVKRNLKQFVNNSPLSTLLLKSPVNVRLEHAYRLFIRFMKLCLASHKWVKCQINWRWVFYFHAGQTVPSLVKFTCFCTHQVHFLLYFVTFIPPALLFVTMNRNSMLCCVLIFPLLLWFDNSFDHD